MPAWSEMVAPDEAERFERYAAELAALAERAGAKEEKNGRLLHRKASAGVEARFVVLPDLPEPARVGIFATPGEHRAYVRFSNGGPKRRSDRSPDFRGIALKIVGVPGRKLIPGLEHATQDFLLLRSPILPVRTTHEFIALTLAAENQLTLLPKLLFGIGIGPTLGALNRVRKILAIPLTAVEGCRWWQPAPIQWGESAVKVSLVPEAAGEPIADTSDRDVVRKLLIARLRQGPIRYDFKIQHYVDEKQTPIENPTVEWAEEVSPFQTVGRLEILQQDVESPRGVKVGEYIESLSFDPWHAPVEFRPLGDIMRARNVAYRVSVLKRNAAPEPDGSERFD